MANVDAVEAMTKDKHLIHMYNKLCAMDGALQVEDYTFCQRIIMMHLLYQ